MKFPNRRLRGNTGVVCATLTTFMAIAPVVLGTPTVTQVSAGSHHTLILKSDGSLWAMGANGNGQLGDGTTNSRYVPVMIVPSNVVAMAAGSYHSLFIKADGNLWATGANGNGQLGDGTTFDQHSPEQITFTGGVTAIAAGGSHSLFLKTNALWGMGANNDGQLGNGNNSDVHSPVQLLSGGVYQIAAGLSHSLYETTDGSLWAMGYNPFGAIGDGTSNTHLTPFEVVTNHSVFTGVSAIAGGWFHSLYLFESPGFVTSLWGMGDNLTGDVGDGSGSTRYSPVEVLTSGASAIAAGYGFSLLIKSDGSLWAAGTDVDGQLGDGNSGQFAESLAFEPIVSSNVTAIAAGGAHSLFLKSDGSLWGMGYNGDGELGDGTTNNTALPKRILPPLQFVVTNLTVSVGTNLMFKGLNEFSGGSTIVYGSTNLTTPSTLWGPLWTNGIGHGNYAFTATGAINPNVPSRFYRLRLFQIQ